MYTLFKISFLGNKRISKLQLPEYIDFDKEANTDDKLGTVRYVIQFDSDNEYKTLADLLVKKSEGSRFLEDITFESDNVRCCMETVFVDLYPQHRMVELESKIGDVTCEYLNTVKECGELQSIEIMAQVKTLSTQS